MQPETQSLQNEKQVIPLRAEDLPLIWSLLTPQQRSQLQRDLPVSAAITDSLCWMQDGWTKTRDDQDSDVPYKPFPHVPYLEVLHKLWLRERVLYVEKSRSMITSWWAAAEALHWIMTHQPAKAIFWAQDERRALLLREYVWVLYEQQAPQLKAISSYGQ